MKAFATTVVAAAALAPARADNLFWLDDKPQAQCMDGTPTGYYFDPSPSGSSNWIIMLEGGGECSDSVTCWSHTKDNLGSSNYFPSHKVMGQIQYQNDTSYNPHFSDWNQVFVPYCSQDLWSGQRTEASDETFGLVFAGHLNLDATLEQLLSDTELPQADTVVFTGESAGGIGAAMNMDFAAAKLYDAGVAQVVGAPIAGFYFEADPYTGPDHTFSVLSNFSASAWPGYYELYDAFVDDDCGAALADEPWRCMIANNSHPYIETPSLFVEAQTDEVVLVYHDWIPYTSHFWDADEQDYMQGWADTMLNALEQLDDTRHGFYNPACFIHTTFEHREPIINDWGYDDAINAFIGGNISRLADDCGIFCNANCPSQPSPSDD